jgi:hypothetical protein
MPLKSKRGSSYAPLEQIDTHFEMAEKQFTSSVSDDNVGPVSPDSASIDLEDKNVMEQMGKTQQLKVRTATTLVGTDMLLIRTAALQLHLHIGTVLDLAFILGGFRIVSS